MSRATEFRPLRGALACAALLAAPAVATTIVPMRDAALVDRARLVVVAETLDRLPVVEERPATDYLMRVERVLKGEVGASTLVVRVPGGLAPDGRELTLFGAPRFQVGERALLFLGPERDGTRRVLQFMQGAFHRARLGGRDIAFRDESEVHRLAAPLEDDPGPMARDFERFADLDRRPRRGGVPLARLSLPARAGAAPGAHRGLHLLRVRGLEPALVQLRQQRLGDLEGAPGRPARSRERRLPRVPARPDRLEQRERDADQAQLRRYHLRFGGVPELRQPERPAVQRPEQRHRGQVRLQRRRHAGDRRPLVRPEQHRQLQRQALHPHRGRRHRDERRHRVPPAELDPGQQDGRGGLRPRARPRPGARPLERERRGDQPDPAQRPDVLPRPRRQPRRAPGERRHRRHPRPLPEERQRRRRQPGLPGRHALPARRALPGHRHLAEPVQRRLGHRRRDPQHRPRRLLLLRRPRQHRADRQDPRLRHRDQGLLQPADQPALHHDRARHPRRARPRPTRTPRGSAARSTTAPSRRRSRARASPRPTRRSRRTPPRAPAGRTSTRSACSTTASRSRSPGATSSTARPASAGRRSSRT